MRSRSGLLLPRRRARLGLAPLNHHATTMSNTTALKKPAADDGALHAKLSAWRNENANAILQRVKDGLPVKLIRNGTTLAQFIPSSHPAYLPKLGDIVSALAEHEGAAIRELDTRTMREAPCQGVDDAVPAPQVVSLPAANAPSVKQP